MRTPVPARPIRVSGVHDPSRNIRSTVFRRGSHGDHIPPLSGRDCTGRPWKGTSRVVDPAGRRKANRATWRAEQTVARRQHVSVVRARRALAAIDEAQAALERSRDSIQSQALAGPPYTHTLGARS